MTQMHRLNAKKNYLIKNNTKKFSKKMKISKNKISNESRIKINYKNLETNKFIKEKLNI